MGSGSFLKLVITNFDVLAGPVISLVYPFGAAFVYQHYVRPIFVTQTANFWFTPREKDTLNRPDEVLLAAEKFIKENGPETLEKLISKVDTSSKFTSRRSTILDDVHAEKEFNSKSGQYPIFDDDYRF